MPKRTDIKKILVIGSGPIVIGQAAEFDYAGTQACLALKEEGYTVVLVNSNPATIMTDKKVADIVYIEPLTEKFLELIIEKEKPQAVLPTLGGQIALNLTVALEERGVFKKHKVEFLGTSIETIKLAENREWFLNLMINLGQKVLPTKVIQNFEQALEFVEQNGFPVIIRSAFTMGGAGGGICKNYSELQEVVERGINASPIKQCLIEKSIIGWKEIEYEVMRDKNDNVIVVTNMENLDPVGVHTGDSIVFAPSQTLSDKENQMLRNAAIQIIRKLKIEGGCNIQFALDPKSFNYYTIEVNPRVSRSSALASKATGYPIANIAAKIAVGLTLSEILNPITKKTFAGFEPSIDYIVCKMPRFPFDKLPEVKRELGTQMQATGEVMAIGRNLEEALLKAISSLEIGAYHLHLNSLATATDEELFKNLNSVTDKRIFIIAELFRRNWKIKKILEKTQIDVFFLDKIANIIKKEKECKNNPFNNSILKEAKEKGFSDKIIAVLWKSSEEKIRNFRKEHKILPVFKMVDTCAAEFEAYSPYFYSTYEEENESIVSKKKKIIIIGSGPIRIGQGIEFDFSTVRAALTIKELGYEAIVVNNNPETLSTDFSISDKLYFEPLSFENVLNIIELEKPFSVVLQFGGQTALNLAKKLEKANVPILGSSWEAIETSENRTKFFELMKKLRIPTPEGSGAFSLEEALEITKKIGFPVVCRPSYVLGGRAFEKIENKEKLIKHVTQILEMGVKHPILIDKYLKGIEVEVEAIANKEETLVLGILEHIEKAGVHSGDSIAVFPTFSLKPSTKNTIKEYTKKICQALKVRGLINIQFVLREEEIFVLEVNLRASRIIPFLSKVLDLPLVNWALKVLLNFPLLKNKIENKRNFYAVKVPVFSFEKLKNVDISLTPEMKSTGEVMGSGDTLPKALYKGLKAAGFKMKKSGSVLLSVEMEHTKKLVELASEFLENNFEIFATKKTAVFLAAHNIRVNQNLLQNKQQLTTSMILQLLNLGKINVVVSVCSKYAWEYKEEKIIREKALKLGVDCLTNLDTVTAYLKAKKGKNFAVEAL